MGEGKRGKPGSELERLQIFVQLATEYFRMVELFTPDGGQVAVDSVEAERRHWVELFRAALLRKFIVPEEHVSLKLIVRALRLCNYSADARITEGTAEAASLFTNGMIRDRQALMAEMALDDHDLFEDVLYGRLLHGDADRFRRSGWAGDYARLSSVAAGRFGAERALRKALGVVSYGLANELLRPPEPGGDAEPPAPEA
ncbi:hypothetical protein [Arthrobacter sp. ES3-54]|jgi:hypothetical protein|uniref:hypothetical protein n=1 Tax=Arthrobacter sp. ES3-54 TaxID=1502991 RepID=UPI00240558F9|nr:hypothetical protein [Arthrobacter sp. ES3-54]MDF9750730.1 hypothetical protein [Arthrobacter sp. ES3-54]